MKDLRLLNESILFPAKLTGKRIQIAVVGNSGVKPEDQERIDAADIVVRFNNFATRKGIAHTQDPFRCNILFSTFDLHSHGAKPDDVVIGIPFPFKAKEIHPKLDRWYCGSNHWMVDPYLNMLMCESLEIDSLGCAHPLPSIGFTALWHMRNWDADFFIAGFNWYSDLSKGTIQGWDVTNRNYPKVWNHNYPKEIEWMIRNLWPKNNIIFSDSCIRILQFVKKKLNSHVS